jgi:hypothetical protein
VEGTAKRREAGFPSPALSPACRSVASSRVNLTETDDGRHESSPPRRAPMSASHDPNFDPERDLVLERVIDVPR